MAEKTSLSDMMDRAPRTIAEANVPGNIDKSTIQEFDPSTVMPKREEKDEFGDEIFGALDAALEVHKEKVSADMDAILDKIDEEREAQAEAAEEAELAAQDRRDAIGSHKVEDEDPDDPSAGLYDDDDDEEEYVPMTAKTTKPAVEETATKAFEEEASVVNTAEVAEEEAIADKPEAKEIHEAVVLPAITREDVENERVSILDAMDDDELDDEDVTAEEPDSDQVVADIKKELSGKIGIKKSFDLSKFTISKKPISASKLMKVATQMDRNIADWVMYHAKRPVALTGLSGPEILKLNPQNAARNRLNTFREMYKVIYDHIEDANKPEFEAWLKATRFIDLTHIYFGLYKATFNGSNYLNYACPKCNKVFIKDVKFDDMVEYDDDETKKEVEALLKLDTTSPKEEGEYEADLVQVSDIYAFSLRTPSIWKVIIETASLSDAFIEKYQNSIDVISYIDEIYYIDEATKSLIPVDTKADPSDMSKTAARRIRAYNDIINGLNSEDYYNLRAKISTIDTDTTKITYLVPEAECPDCHTIVEENRDMTPDQMLFTRHQLAAIVSM